MTPDQNTRSPELLASLDRHFAAGCPALSTSQLREHQASGACRECSKRAREAGGELARTEGGQP